MPKRIVLLTGKREAPFLADYIHKRSPGLKVDPVTDLAALRDVLQGGLRGVRLISFCSGVIVPADLLRRLNLTPYNIHPGPPSYPGLHPDAYAVVEKARKFGATAHEIWADVDSGPIVALREFDVAPGTGRLALADLAYRAALELYAAVAAFCLLSDASMEPLDIVWRGRAKRLADYQALCRLHPEIKVEPEAK